MVKVNEVKKEYLISIIIRITILLLGFLNTILINRSLGVALRGEYTVITNYVNIFQQILNFGIGSVFPFFYKENPDSAKKTFSKLICWQMTIYTPIAILISIIGHKTDITFIAIMTVLSVLQTEIMFLAIVENIVSKSKRQLIIYVIYTVLLFVVYLIASKNLYIVLSILGLQYLGMTLMFMHGIKFKFGYRPFCRYDFFIILKKCIPAMIMNLLIYINYHADVVCLDLISGNSYEIGLYGTGVTLASMLWVLPEAFKDVLLSRSAKKDNPKEIVVCIFASVILSLIIIVGFFFLGRSFITLLYGIEFIESFSMTLLLFVGAIPMSIYLLIHPIYISNGEMNVIIIILTVAAASNILGNFILIPKMDGMGAAISSVISYCVCGMFFYIKFKSDYRVSEFALIKEIIAKLKH